MKSKILSTAAIFLLPSILMAQQKDTSLKNTTIEVIQSYKPEVKQAPKPEFVAQLPPRDTSRPRFTYEVPQQTLLYSYSSLPLRPLALGKDTTQLPFANYLKIGGGNKSTIYLDAGIGSINGINYETNIHLHHLSQNGNIKNQQIALSGIDAEGTLHFNNNAWRISLEGMRNQYHYFGYDHSIYDYSNEAVKQTFTAIQALIDVRNEEKNKLGIDYHPTVGFSYYGDNYDAKERTIILDIPITKEIDESLKAGIGLNSRITRLTNSLGDQDNNIFQITPNLVFQRTNFTGKIGVYPTFGRNGNSYLLPDINLSVKIPNTQFMISAGWLAVLKQNTYKELSTINPYIFNSYQIRQTRKDEIFGMVRTNIGDHFFISARVSWWEFNNLPLYLNDTSDRKNFYIVNDEKVNAISLEGAIRYQVANNFSTGVTLSIYNFNQHAFDKVWHEPGIRLKGDMLWKPTTALSVTAYATMLDQIYARNIKKETVKLDGVFDIGLGAEYLFIPRLSVFLNVNNLLNDRYQRWYGYESYGINLYGGIRFKF